MHLEEVRMIPVYVNVFNRLTTTRRLCEQVSRLENCYPVIIDNASTWEPLLEWYSNCPYEVIRLDQNIGHRAPWLSGSVRPAADLFWSQIDSEFYIITDCDIDIEGVPLDVASVLQIPFQWSRPEWSAYQSDYFVVKSGLALRIDDIPEKQGNVLRWESQFWTRPVEEDARFFWARIDTTFVMIHKSTWHKRAMHSHVVAVRIAGEYQARHMPWYYNANNVDAETLNYYQTAGRSSTWRPSGRRNRRLV